MSSSLLTAPGGALMDVAAVRAYRLAQARPLRFRWVLGALALHVVLGGLCKIGGYFATLHALGTLFFGLYLALRGRSLFRVACWGMYVAGAEVLWRMAGASLPWEFGKYAVSGVFLVRLFRGIGRPVPWGPILYFVLLLPAVFPTVAWAFSSHSWDDTRKLVSFNLSGPFSILVCSIFFSQIRLNDLRTQRLIAWLVVPVAGIATAILLGITSLERLEFDNKSNFLTSGGFAPNQVSTALGLGALYSLLLLLGARLNVRLRVVFAILFLWFAAHAALSFSRTGIYLLGAGFVVALPFLSIGRLLRPRTLIIVAVTLATGFTTWICLMRYTEGKLGQRLSTTSLTRRDLIAMQDLDIWRHNYVFGAGVGASSIAHTEGTAGRYASHTEYTRLLAEHGLLGLLSGVFLLGLATRPLYACRSRFTKAAVLAGVTVTLLSLAVSAMRTAAPGFLIGMASARMGGFQWRHRNRGNRPGGPGS